jgi:hypothetical protein
VASELRVRTFDRGEEHRSSRPEQRAGQRVPIARLGPLTAARTPPAARTCRTHSGCWRRPGCSSTFGPGVCTRGMSDPSRRSSRRRSVSWRLSSRSRLRWGARRRCLRSCRPGCRRRSAPRGTRTWGAEVTRSARSHRLGAAQVRHPGAAKAFHDARQAGLAPHAGIEVAGVTFRAREQLVLRLARAGLAGVVGSDACWPEGTTQSHPHARRGRRLRSHHRGLQPAALRRLRERHEVRAAAGGASKPVTQLKATVTRQDGEHVLEGVCWCYTLRPSKAGCVGGRSAPRARRLAA